MAERNTRIRFNQIASVRPDDLDATNILVDDYVPSYDQATGKFTWVENVGGSGGSGGSGGYTASFTNASLNSAGILVVTHNLGALYPLVVIYDNNNLVIEPDEIEYKSSNQIEVDLSSFVSLTGTWNIRVNAGGLNSINDIGDVDFDSGTPVDNDVLKYDSSSGKWKASSMNFVKVYEGAFTASSSITVSGLDLDSDGCYFIEIYGYTTDVIDVWIQCNSSSTTHYYTQEDDAGGNSSTDGWELIHIGTNPNLFYITGFMSKLTSQAVVAQFQVMGDINSTTGVMGSPGICENWYCTWKNTNLTSLKIHTGSANTFNAGGKIRIWAIKS